jgi:hypothetical protein
MDVYVRDGEAGGSEAAHCFGDAVDMHVTKHHPGLASCDIVVRAYADYGVLSAEMSMSDSEVKMGMVQTFAQGFSTAGVMFDFVNIASRANVRRKMTSWYLLCTLPNQTNIVTGTFQWHVQDWRCKHIYFIATDQPAYMDILQSQREDIHGVTLVREELLDGFEVLKPSTFFQNTSAMSKEFTKAQKNAADAVMHGKAPKIASPSSNP